MQNSRQLLRGTSLHALNAIFILEYTFHLIGIDELEDASSLFHSFCILSYLVL